MKTLIIPLLFTVFFFTACKDKKAEVQNPPKSNPAAKKTFDPNEVICGTLDPTQTPLQSYKPAGAPIYEHWKVVMVERKNQPGYTDQKKFWIIKADIFDSLHARDDKTPIDVCGNFKYRQSGTTKELMTESVSEYPVVMVVTHP